jgi:hypothetical protein
MFTVSNLTKNNSLAKHGTDPFHITQNKIPVSEYIAFFLDIIPCDFIFNLLYV